MARRLRIQYENALYHVINRGNYRSDVFSSAGAARAFQAAMGEACERYRWRVHAYVIMRNHYHLALETPQPNLVEGMHWLQSTFATRRSGRGQAVSCYISRALECLRRERLTKFAYREDRCFTSIDHV